MILAAAPLVRRPRALVALLARPGRGLRAALRHALVSELGLRPASSSASTPQRPVRDVGVVEPQRLRVLGLGHAALRGADQARRHQPPRAGVARRGPGRQRARADEAQPPAQDREQQRQLTRAGRAPARARRTPPGSARKRAQRRSRARGGRAARAARSSRRPRTRAAARPTSNIGSSATSIASARSDVEQPLERERERGHADARAAAAARSTSGDRSSLRSIAWVDTALPLGNHFGTIPDGPSIRKAIPTYVQVDSQRPQLLGVRERVAAQLAAGQHLVGAHPPQRRRVGVDRDRRLRAGVADAVDVGGA